jgi:hypothetical protein
MPGSTVKNPVTVLTEVMSAPAGVTVVPSTEADLTFETEPIDGSIPIQITELLPNPSGIGNDAADEYIELYNPNDSDFDLSGYKLQTGISRLYNFTFKADTSVPAKSHRAFYSSMTGLTLSNTLGQARVMSPSGESVSATDVYRTAKDGQSWSLLNNIWNWSELTTPNTLNVLQIPKAADKKSVPASSNLAKKPAREPTTKKLKPAKAPKVAKSVKPKKIKAEKTTKYSSGPDTKTLMERPVQTKLVATVGSVAVLYGAYEYRSSLANGFYKLRRKLSFSRSDRS